MKKPSSQGVRRQFYIDGKEVTDEEYAHAFAMQCTLYGSVVNRTSLTDDLVMRVELIDYGRIGKALGEANVGSVRLHKPKPGTISKGAD